MTAASFPLDGINAPRLEQGATYRSPVLVFNHPLVDADGVPIRDADGNLQPGDPYNFTDCNARMDVRIKLTDAQPTLSITNATGIYLGGLTGRLSFTIPDEMTKLLGLPHTPRAVLAAVYDLELEWPGGEVDRLLEGPIVVKPSVTRSNDA